MGHNERHICQTLARQPSDGSVVQQACGCLLISAGAPTQCSVCWNAAQCLGCWCFLWVYMRHNATSSWLVVPLRCSGRSLAWTLQACICQSYRL